MKAHVTCDKFVAAVTASPCLLTSAVVDINSKENMTRRCLRASLRDTFASRTIRTTLLLPWCTKYWAYFFGMVPFVSSVPSFDDARGTPVV
jgi:hypothetical protein